MSEQGGESRRGFLKCMSWAGTGLVWTLAGGVPAPVALEAAARPAAARPFSFVQISDSRLGFSKPFAADTRVTFREAVAKPCRPTSCAACWACAKSASSPATTPCRSPTRPWPEPLFQRDYS